MTPEQLATKLRFAGEAVPSMTRRRDGHNYCARRMYLITMTVEGRRPLLGTVVGNPEAEHGTQDAPRMELSPLGRAVEKHWMEINEHYPQVEVLALQLMPDHLHGILFVKEKMPQHLGQVIKGFKIATNRVYRSVCSAAIVSQPTRRQPLPNRKQGMLWSIGYTDGILDRRGQLANWLNYLRDNPRRLLMKRSRPEFFRVQRNIKVGEFDFSAIGNRFLLSHPVRLQVQCSRSLSEEQIEMRKHFFLEKARCGAVLVSPSISPGEKSIMRAAFDAGFPLILLQENGFTEMAKPGGSRFDACADGRLLILSPWEHHNQRLNISRGQCLSLNEMAKVICAAYS
jgi:REP element-mobilizing transposase RayT